MPQPALPEVPEHRSKRWLDVRQVLSVEYYHVVFTLPAPIADIAYQNKAALYGLLFDIAAQTVLRIAADPKHLGTQIGATLVLHIWGSALSHHPHVHGIVPGGGLAPDGMTWVVLPPGVLPASARAVYAKQPVAGPQAVLAYLSRYAYRVAISNSRLLAMDERGVTFRWKGYRANKPGSGKKRHKTMTLSSQEFMRHFMRHLLPAGFHRIRHQGMLANSNRRDNLALARQLLQVTPLSPKAPPTDGLDSPRPTIVFSHSGQAMTVLRVCLRDCSILAPPAL